MEKPKNRKTFFFLASKKLIARKNPKRPELKACRKVAEMNRKPAKVKVSPSCKKDTSEDMKIKIFSKAAKPKPAMII